LPSNSISTSWAGSPSPNSVAPAGKRRRLAEMAERYGRDEDGHVPLSSPLSQADLAALTGLSRVAVVKVLRVLRELGWIENRGRSHHPGARPTSAPGEPLNRALTSPTRSKLRERPPPHSQRNSRLFKSAHLRCRNQRRSYRLIRGPRPHNRHIPSLQCAA
jgi:hypothetical protein